MARSKQIKKKNEGKRKPHSPKPTKSKNGRLKQKATNKYNSKALESIYGSITRESANWGKRTRAMNEPSYQGKPYAQQGSKKRQRPNYNVSKNNNRKSPPPKPQFQLRMPPTVPVGQIPWWTKPTSKPSQKKMKLLDEIKVDPQSMCVLDHELEAFSKYVQLSTKEIETRESLIETIRSEAKERFGIKDSDVKVFGSYAARPVCTFESDVDLVIWGLVEDQPSRDDSEIEEEYPVLKDTAPLPQLQEPQLAHKETKIMKWKAAIDEFEKQLAQVSEKNNGKTESKVNSKKKPATGGIHAGKDDSDTAATASNSESPISENDQFEDADEKSSTNEIAVETKVTIEEETSFFVIDRVGDESEAKADDTKDDSAPLSPLKDKMLTATGVAADSDDDTADKLEGLESREASKLDTSGDGSEFPGMALLDAFGEGVYFEEARDALDDDDNDDDEEDEQEEDLIETPKNRSRSHSLVSLSSATTCSDNQMINEDGMEVSFVTNATSRSIISRRPQKLSDGVRLVVNSKLNQLSKRIRKSGVATSIELRKWARVPILNMKTRYGYECDIGVGGHNGNDTSAYAGAQISQHPSFAPVVMLLKILLNQHDLDKPFTGGLGSFKLYVLVANHIQQHLTCVGSATSSEILMTFFYRYGDIRSYRHVDPNARTDLMRIDAVHCHDGGVVEVSQVFQMENCVAVFRSCWWTLMKALSSPTTTSLLRLIVDARRLRQRRETANSMNSFTHHRQTQSQLRGHVSSLHRYSNNNHENRAISKVFKGGGKQQLKKKYQGGKWKSK